MPNMSNSEFRRKLDSGEIRRINMDDMPYAGRWSPRSPRRRGDSTAVRGIQHKRIKRGA